MSDIAIRVENLGKRYRIGGKQEPYKTLRESLVDAVAAPVKALGSAIRRERNESRDNTIWALDDVSFVVKHGEVIGVIGRNGAGKSTLLKVLSRITEPTSGLVEINGRVGSLLEVGTGFHPELTGRENIYLNGAILGMKRVEINRRFDEIVDFSGVEKFLDTPVKRYSSGMQVRLAFSIAAHLEPEILLVDEVLAVGDSEFQKKCLGKMGDVASEGRTVLFVSHNLAAIGNLCGRSLLFDQGQLCEDGPTVAVLDAYQEAMGKNIDVASLLADRTDRVGSGIARFTTMRMLDDQGNPTDMVPMNGILTFEIGYEAFQEIEYPIFGVFFKDIFARTILRGYSHESGQYVPIRPTESGTVRCTFENLPLMHGTYSIALWLGRPGQCIDDIEHVAMVSVIARDVYGTGVLPDSYNGGVCFSMHHWEFNSDH